MTMTERVKEHYRTPWYEKYKVELEDGEVDGVKIDHFEITKGSTGALHYALHGRPVPHGVYTRLSADGVLWMTDTPAEISDLITAFHHLERATTKRVIINGLGLGMVLKATLALSHVEHVDVVEIDPRVVQLVGSQYQDARLTIHTADAYDVKWPVGTCWDVAWHDVWPTICGDNADGMTRLNRRYGNRVNWQGCWVEDEVRRLHRY